MSFRPTPSFALPAANLGPDRRPDFHAGKALARQPWVQAPSITDARDGLGPLYNARSCLACHVSGGRGLAPDADGPLSAATLVRLSVPGRDQHGGALPEPTYGSQLQPQSIALSHQLRATDQGAHAPTSVAPEAQVTVVWKRRIHRYPDGREVSLRYPEISFEGLAYGELDPRARIGLRHTPSLAGLGLLALIDDRDIESQADPDDADGDGVSGRANQVWDPVERRVRLGRFGLKANQPGLRVQVAAAFHGDLGITTSVFPALPCAPGQRACARAPHGGAAGGPEVSDDLLALVVDFVASIGVPERRKPDHPLVQRGRTLFHRSGCASCHTPRYVTRVDPRHEHLSGQEIWPYTDLLLHDMGEELADGRPDYLATGSEWRTPPLWGVGLARAVREEVGFLHDGRARNAEEAVLWHGGEARASRRLFEGLAAGDRKALLAFLRSL